MTTIAASTVGDPSRFVSLDALVRGLDALPDAPRDRGRVALVVRRVTSTRRRETPARVALTPDGGTEGDAWARRPTPEPDMQIAVMEHAVAELIADGQPLELFGDNLFVDLDLSAANLPPGSRLRLGTAEVVVTPQPHDGCKKFRARFGSEALRFVAHPERRARNLRGIYLRVVERGEVGPGDPIEVLERPGP